MRELTLDEVSSIGGGVDDTLNLGKLGTVTGIRAGMTALGVAGALLTVGTASYTVATRLGAGELGGWIGRSVYDLTHSSGSSGGGA